MDLNSAVRSYGEFQATRGDSPTHRKECVRILTTLQEHLGNRAVDRITVDDLRGFILAVRQRKGVKGRAQVSDLTVSAYHRTVSAFFAYLVQQQQLRSSPMQDVPKPRVGQYLIEPFSVEQLRKLLAQPDVSTFTGLRDMVLMCFLLDTGCRISETLGITFEDLDLERRLARVLGKGRKERLVPFGEKTLAWLGHYLDKRRRSEETRYLFVNQYGERLSGNAISHRIAAYGRQAGLRGVRASPHTFRHTFAVNWLMGEGEYKGDALSLQKILGHSTPAMTQRYVHLTGQELRTLHDRLSPSNRLVAEPPSDRRRRLR